MKKIFVSLFLCGVFLMSNSISAFAAVGKLKITCYPAAYIFIDGQAALLGSTTKKLEIVVDVGKHVITAEVSDYEMEEAKIEIFAHRTLEINLVLVKKGQNRDEMVSISDGILEMGIDEKRIGWLCKNIGGCANDYKASTPRHDVKLKAYKIDAYEVTNKQYKKFIDATKQKAPKGWRRGNNYRKNQGDYPVVNVSWSDAAAYCKWAGKRLPTEAEWEYAATAGKSFYYPWGKKFRIGRANTMRERFQAPTITGRYEKGVSKFGCYDMSGNVWEWTANLYKSYSGDGGAKDENMRVVRGGSYEEQPFMTTTVYRHKLKAKKTYPNVGFRCVK